MKEITGIDDFVKEDEEPDFLAALDWLHNARWEPRSRLPEPQVEIPSATASGGRSRSGSSRNDYDNGIGTDCVDLAQNSYQSLVLVDPEEYEEEEETVGKQDAAADLPEEDVEPELELLVDDPGSPIPHAEYYNDMERGVYVDWQMELVEREEKLAEEESIQDEYEDIVNLPETVAFIEDAKVCEKEWQDAKDAEEAEKQDITKSWNKWAENLELKKKQLIKAKQSLNKYIREVVAKFQLEEVPKLIRARKLNAELQDKVRQLGEQAIKCNEPKELGSLSAELESAPNPDWAPTIRKMNQLCHVNKIMNKKLQAVTHKNMYVATFTAKLESGGGDMGASVFSTGIGETPDEAYKNALTSAYAKYKNKTSSSRASSVCGSTISSRYRF